MRVLSRVTPRTPLILLVGLGIAATVITIWLTGLLEGADHAEAPGVLADPQADINDIYAFRSPENPDNLVVALTVNPLTAPPENDTRNFATDVAYEIHVDNTADFVAAPFVPAAGLRPAGETPSDTLAGLNVSAIVVELPITALTGEATSDTGVIRAWATTSRGGVRIDRMAIPAINTAAVPSGSKDTYNQGDPVNDVEAFLAAATDEIQRLRDAVDAVLPAPDGGPLGDVSAGGVAAAVLPDVVTIDFSKPVDFPNLNGRTLTDDVIDIALALVLDRTVGDAIDANDVPFLDSFPYLAPPHQPAVVVSMSLPSGLSLVGWFGRDTTSAELLAANPVILRIWTFDSSTGQYILDTEELPSGIRPTIEITRGMGFFVLTSRATTIQVELP